MKNELSIIYDTPVIPGRTLLFLDEIQSCIPAISSLRFFYEEYPELHVIAAGSLLEFALQEIPSYGVGRIRSIFLYPFSFDEFLHAMNLVRLADALQKSSPENPFSEEIPLAAEMNTKHRKYLIFDTGIYQRFLKLDLGQLLFAEKLEQVNKGALAELFVGLELLKSVPCTNPIQLYYWQREKPGSSAEVDYIVQCNADIVPLEVKSGTKGSMQSMFQFLNEKNIRMASDVQWKISAVFKT